MQIQKPKQGYKLVKSLFGKEEEIPEDWKYEKILDNSTLKGRIGWQGLSTAEYRQEGEFYLVTGTDFKDGRIDWENCVYVGEERFVQDENIQLKKGDVLVTKDGTIGKIAFLDKLPLPTTLNSGVFVIRPIDNAYFPLFLFYILYSNYFMKFLNRLKAGSTINHLYQKDFVNFHFPIPPHSEQRKIAAILSNVDELINKYDFIIENSKKLKKNLIQQLLARGIGHTKFKKVKWRFGKEIEIPEEWNHSKMKDVCKKISVGIATSTTKYFVDRGIPLLRNQNIKEGYIETDDLLHISEEFTKMNESKKLQEGDVVCMRTGYPGQSAVVPAEMNDWQTFTTLIVRPNHEILDSHYLSVFLNSYGRKQITSIQAGAAQQNLNVGWLSNMLISLPLLNEQQKITSIISGMDERINDLESKKISFKKLKKGLTQKLLTGKIRV